VLSAGARINGCGAPLRTWPWSAAIATCRACATKSAITLGGCAMASADKRAATAVAAAPTLRIKLDGRDDVSCGLDMSGFPMISLPPKRHTPPNGNTG